MTLRSVSYGGGVQSTALLVLAAQGFIDFPVFLFANVGDQAEHPATLRYVREVAFDYAAAHGIEMHELHRTPTRGVSAGQPEDLWDRLMRPESRSLPIPVRMPDTGAPGTRSCTADFKIRVVGKWLRDHGATADDPATVAVGISTDEWERANARTVEPYENVVYPLLKLETRRGIGLNRAQCEAVIRDAGLPVPRKSSCFFCPFHKPTVWVDMARDEPELFAKSVLLEDTLNERRARMACPKGGERAGRAVLDGVEDGAELPEDAEHAGWLSLPVGQYHPCTSCHAVLQVQPDGTWPAHRKGPVYLTRFGKPLRDWVGNQGEQQSLDLSDEGYRCGDVCDT
jgi:hypothetical protein